MNDEIKKVENFHKVFKLGVGENYRDKLPESLVRLRHELIREENEEYLEAALKGDYVEVADALGDLLFVIFGTAVEHGLQNKLKEVFEEIYSSNMSKLGPKGEVYYREDGKALKGPNYFPPNLDKILNN